MIIECRRLYNRKKVIPFHEKGEMWEPKLETEQSDLRITWCVYQPLHYSSITRAHGPVYACSVYLWLIVPLCKSAMLTNSKVKNKVTALHTSWDKHQVIMVPLAHKTALKPDFTGWVESPRSCADFSTTSGLRQGIFAPPGQRHTPPSHRRSSIFTCLPKLMSCCATANLLIEAYILMQFVLYKHAHV